MLVAFVDAEQRYAFVNATHERWFGHSKAEAIGRYMHDVLGAAAYETIRPHVERALAGELQRFEAEVPYRDGGPRFIEATYVPQRAADGSVSGFVALVADVSDRKTRERLSQAAAARSERLLKITAALADAVHPEQVFEAVVDRVAAAVDASSAAIWLLDDDGRTARLARAIGYAEAAKKRFEAVPLDGPEAIPAIDALARGEPVWISSQAQLLARYPHLQSSVTPGRHYRVSCLPLAAHGRTLGVLGLTIEESKPPSDDERDFLLLVASYGSQAVERLRLLEAERRSRAAADAAAARTGVLSQVSRAFVEADLDFDARIAGIVRELGTALHSCIGIALQHGDGLQVQAVYHPDPRAEQQLRELGAASPLHTGEGVSGTVGATGRSVLLAGIEPSAVAERASPAYRAYLQRYPVYAVICTPLRVRGQIIGTLAASRTQRGESYDGDDLLLLEELADRAAAAIENARLYHDNSRARARAERLYRFANVVVTADCVEQVFEAALDAILGALGTERAAILLFDGDGVTRFRAFRGLSEDYRRAVEGHSPWPRDAAAPAPLLIADVERDHSVSALRALLRQERIGSLAFIPLVTRGRLLGKFMVYYGEPHEFTAHEIELASALANHLASVTARFAAVAKLEETIRYNELFAGVLAHDLRNPLGAIMTAAQLVLMRQEGEGDRNAKPLGRILTSGQRMTRMIDQLLDFTRARAGGGIEIHPRDADLAELCAQAIGEIELAFPECNVQLTVIGNQSGCWDPDRLLQIISNLLANAGQHGEPGSVVRITLDGREPDRAVLQIHNRGAVPESLLPSLFDPFRSARHRRDQSRGLGLGLFIVREIARAHGGTVEVASTPADGTTFTLRLPRTAPAHGAR